MTRTAIFTFMILSLLRAVGQDQKILINESFMGKNRISMLNEISNNYNVTFEYDKKLFPKDVLPAKFFKNKPLPEVLDVLLDGLELHYIIHRNNVIIRPTSESFSEMFTPTQENFTLEGVLLDRDSDETLPYATVLVNGTTNGTTSNVDGLFTLFEVPSDTSTLEIRYIGYQTTYHKLRPEEVKEKRVKIYLDALTTELEEIVITDTKEHMIKTSERISQTTISPAQLYALPNLGEKDIFRSLQLLPGISATNETSSGLYVRGGTPDQNLVLFDGFTVYHVDHFYGFFSAFNSNAVKDVQLYKGGFDAKFGGRLSSVVELTGKTGNSNRVSGNVGISGLSVNGSLELPFAEGKGNFFIAGRRSYTDIIQSKLYDNIFNLFEEESTNTNQQVPRPPGGGRRPGGVGFAENQTQPSFFFYDFNTKLSYRPTDKDIVSLSLYNGKDNLDNSSDFDSNSLSSSTSFNNTFNNNTVDLNQWGNWGSSLKWARQWNDKWYSNTVFSYSNYFTDRDRYSETSITRADSTFSINSGTIEDNNVHDVTLKTDLEYRATDDHTLGFGAQATYNSVNYSRTQNDTLTILDRNDQEASSAIYAQDNWNVNDKLTITPGLRLAHYTGTNKLYLEPRISGSYQLNERLKLKAAWGLYNQFVTRVVREDISEGSRDFWLLANDEQNPVSSSAHYILGGSYETSGFLFDVEAYHKALQGLSEYTLRLSGGFRNRTPDYSELFYEGSGYARGVEFLVQKKFGQYTGWLGYTLSEVIHEFPEISDNRFPALHDQTHEFKSVNSFRLGNWTLAGTWVFATGKPYTSPIGGYELTLLDGSTSSYVSVGEKNGFRLPNYHRLDASITYNWRWNKTTVADIGLSIFNLYNRDNIWYKTFEVVDEDMVTTDVTTIGMTPNVFFNIKF